LVVWSPLGKTTHYTGASYPDFRSESRPITKPSAKFGPIEFGPQERLSRSSDGRLPADDSTDNRWRTPPSQSAIVRLYATGRALGATVFRNPGTWHSWLSTSDVLRACQIGTIAGHSPYPTIRSSILRSCASIFCTRLANYKTQSVFVAFSRSRMLCPLEAYSSAGWRFECPELKESKLFLVVGLDDGVAFLSLPASVLSHRPLLHCAGCVGFAAHWPGSEASPRLGGFLAAV